MDGILRGLAIYFFLLLIFRLAGKRTLHQTTTFDFVLLLIISEVTQQGLLGEDYSVTNAIVLIVTLVVADIGLSVLKQRFKTIDWLIDGVPVLLVKDGQPLRERLDTERLDEEDILTQARLQRGLERFDQIKYAVLERDGTISVIPDRRALARTRPPGKTGSER
jgi:uncharacterized membrane protein YcaP (DUF421 family)